MQRLVGELEQALEEQERKTVNLTGFIRLAKKYAQFEELTPHHLNKMIDRIEVHAKEKRYGKKTQKVDIRYKFVGVIGQLDIPKLKCTVKLTTTIVLVRLMPIRFFVAKTAANHRILPTICYNKSGFVGGNYLERSRQ